jgi:Mn2+/Fe2+ NRAMP family transporter
LKFKPNPYLGAAFLMATSAIGPGFLTQTTVFTQQLLQSFGFVIICSIVIDIVAQTTIWKVLTSTGLKAHELGNSVFPFLGYFLSFLVVFGGLVFNIGNLAGAGLGLNALLGVSTTTGTIFSAFLVMLIFFSKQYLNTLDRIVQVLGVSMVILLVFMVFSNKTPLPSVVKYTFLPKVIDYKAIVTLVGGTVGGYITFAGAHRLIDGGFIGKKYQEKVKKTAFFGILITGTLRYLLFLTTLAVLLSGYVLPSENPTSGVFISKLGNIGKLVFGFMIWAASITSVMGATYTSLSFIKSFHKNIAKNEDKIAVLFLLVSLSVIILYGKPIFLLVFAGYLNGFILPIGLAIVLWSKHIVGIKEVVSLSKIWVVLGWMVVVSMSYFAIQSLFN